MLVSIAECFPKPRLAIEKYIDAYAVSQRDIDKLCTQSFKGGQPHQRKDRQRHLQP